MRWQCSWGGRQLWQLWIFNACPYFHSENRRPLKSGRGDRFTPFQELLMGPWSAVMVQEYMFSSFYSFFQPPSSNLTLSLCTTIYIKEINLNNKHEWIILYINLHTSCRHFNLFWQKERTDFENQFFRTLGHIWWRSLRRRSCKRPSNVQPETDFRIIARTQGVSVATGRTASAGRLKCSQHSGRENTSSRDWRQHTVTAGVLAGPWPSEHKAAVRRHPDSCSAGSQSPAQLSTTPVHQTASLRCHRGSTDGLGLLICVTDVRKLFLSYLKVSFLIYRYRYRYRERDNLTALYCKINVQVWAPVVIH